MVDQTLGSILAAGKALQPAIAAASQADRQSSSQLAAISYQELRQICASMDTQLKYFGFSRCEVALLAPHSLETAVLLVALAAAGWTVAPMNPSLAAETIKFVLEETKAKIVVVSCTSQSTFKEPMQAKWHDMTSPILFLSGRLQVPPLDQADGSQAEQAAKELGICACRCEAYTYGSGKLELAPLFASDGVVNGTPPAK